MQVSRAITVVKAATRLKVLAERARARLAAEQALLENGDEAGEAINRVESVSELLSVKSAASMLSRHSALHSMRAHVVRNDFQAVKEIFTSSWINLLLVCVPLGWASYFLGWGPVPTFTLNFLSLIPLALILGDITEDLALRFGDVIGGLLNASFGNVVEIILSVAALMKGLYNVVAMSLIGSILSNLLLVLGSCFLFGGMTRKEQYFNETANKACSSLLFLATIGIMIPTAAQKLHKDYHGFQDPDYILDISRGAAIILFVMYILYLVFQLYTHKDMFSGEEDDDQALMTVPCAIGLLSGIAIVVAISSEFLTGALEAVAEQTGLSEDFLGMVVLPIAGNACEHITAIIVAVKDKMDLALGVAVGSSIQIAMFAIPFVVLLGWATGHPFSLNFHPFAVLALVIAVIHANFVTTGGTSHWMMGAQLVSTYLMIALAFFFS